MSAHGQQGHVFLTGKVSDAQLKSLYLTTDFSHAWPKLRWSQFFVHLGCIGLPIALTIRARGIEH